MLQPGPPLEDFPTTAAPTDDERRGCLRYMFRHPPMLRFLVRPTFQSGRGFLQNLSTEGAGLLVGQQLHPGTVLFIQLRGLRRGTTRTQLARVLHCTQHASGRWMVGCRWTCPLSAEDLHDALTDAS